MAKSRIGAPVPGVYMRSKLRKPPPIQPSSRAKAASGQMSSQAGGWSATSGTVGSAISAAAPADR